MQAILTIIGALLGLAGLPALIAVGMATYAIHVSKDAITEKVKAAIKAEYDDRLERLKSELKANADIELERQKHLLTLDAQRYNLQYSRLQERRTTVIADLYAALTETVRALRQYVAVYEPAGMAPRQERYEVLAKAHKKLVDIFEPNKIYLPKEIELRIADLNNEIFGSANNFSWGVHRATDAPQSTKKWMEIWERVEGPLTQSLRELEDEFRKLMGGELDRR